MRKKQVHKQKLRAFCVATPDRGVAIQLPLFALCDSFTLSLQTLLLCIDTRCHHPHAAWDPGSTDTDVIAGGQPDSTWVYGHYVYCG